MKERILIAAERIFAEEGAPGLSMRKLAEAVELSPAAIYKYFENKSAVIEALRDAFFSVFLVRLDAVERGISDPLQGLRAGMAAYVQVALEKPHHYRAAFTLDAAADDEPGQGPEAKLSPDNPRGMAYRHLFEKLESVAGALHERPADLDIAAKSVWASIHGLAMLMIKLPHWPEIGREAMIAGHIDIVAKGVFPKSA